MAFLLGEWLVWRSPLFPVGRPSPSRHAKPQTVTLRNWPLLRVILSPSCGFPSPELRKCGAPGVVHRSDQKLRHALPRSTRLDLGGGAPKECSAVWVWLPAN